MEKAKERKVSKTTNKKLLVFIITLSAILLAAYVSLPAQAATQSFVIKDEDNGSTISGNGGDTITFSGAGYAASDDQIALNCISVNGVTYSGGNPIIEVSTDPAGSGIFSITLSNLETSGGTYVLQAVGETSGLSASASFTILPTISFDVDSGPSGTTVQVTGNGFAQDPLSDGMQATFGSTTITLNDLTNDGNGGNFQANFDVPTTAVGPYTVTITDSTDTSIHAQATFTVTSISPLPEYPLGALIAVIACFATFALFAKRGSIGNFRLKL